MTDHIHIIITLVDWILFAEVTFTTFYLLFFAIAAFFSPQKQSQEKAKVQRRILVLFPAYKEDAVIESTVRFFLDQEYPRDLYDVIVISDHMDEMTNLRLAQLPITVLTPNFKESSKAKSLRYAIRESGSYKQYDVVLVLDADNIVDPTFLISVNRAFDKGSFIIQAHRISKNTNTDTALLDSIFEEINNSIFRKGHIAVGLSAGLVGSGIAYKYQWFVNHIDAVNTSGEDKEFEALIMYENIFVDYLDDVFVLDEKTQHTKDFNNQRRRWVAAQAHSFLTNFYRFPSALMNGQYDYADKILQWGMLPRILMVGIIAMMSTILAFWDLSMAFKWWGIALILLFTFALATPDYLVDENFTRIFRKIPIIVLTMMFNLFRLRGLKNKFLHTKHTITQ